MREAIIAAIIVIVIITALASFFLAWVDKKNINPFDLLYYNWFRKKSDESNP